MTFSDFGEHCVNYEARTSREPKPKNAKRRLKNYKLKHSRLLTCYSGLLYLLGVFTLKKTVGPNDAEAMVGITPTERLEWLLTESFFADAHPKVRQLIECYERFLQSTEAPENVLIERFLDDESSRSYMRSASDFGNVVFDVLETIGRDNRFYRLLVV